MSYHSNHPMHQIPSYTHFQSKNEPEADYDEFIDNFDFDGHKTMTFHETLIKDKFPNSYEGHQQMKPKYQANKSFHGRD